MSFDLVVSDISENETVVMMDVRHIGGGKTPDACSFVGLCPDLFLLDFVVF